MNIRQVKRFPKGIIHMPPSKSAAHRAIICAGLAVGESILKNISFSQDIEATIRCMRALGVMHETVNSALHIKGGIHRPHERLDCGESGSTLRFLISIAALLGDTACFTGRGRVLERPLEPYLNELAAHGVVYSQDAGELRIRGPVTPGIFHIPGDISSQFVSGLLLALPLLRGDSEIVMTTPLQSAGYVDMTMDVMRQFAVAVEREGYQKFVVRGNQSYHPQTFCVEGDYSQAAFFLVAGALGSPCDCAGLSPESKQGDKAILDILSQCGAEVVKGKNGTIGARPGRLSAQSVDVSNIPDLVPPLAVLLCFCDGASHITNAARLRHKESDRLQTVAQVLNTLGAQVTVEDEGLTIVGVNTLRGGQVQTFGDHRIAMMAAVAATRSEEPVFIEGSSCVAKSYPNFWEDFEKAAKGDR